MAAGAVCGWSRPKDLFTPILVSLASPEGAGQEGYRLYGCLRVLTSALDRGMGKPPPARNALVMT